MAATQLTRQESSVPPVRGPEACGGPAVMPSEGPGLRHVAAVLSDYWWVVLLCLLVGGGIGAHSWRRRAESPLFRASTCVEITADTRDGKDAHPGPARQELIDEELTRLTVMLRSGTIHSKVAAKLRAEWAERLGGELPPADVVVTPLRGSTAMLDVGVDSTHGDFALAFLNQAFTEYDADRLKRIEVRQERATASLQRECESLQSQLADARSELLSFQVSENTRLHEAQTALDDQFLAGLIQRENAVRMERTMIEAQLAAVENASAATLNDLLALNLETHRAMRRPAPDDEASAARGNAGEVDVGSAVFGVDRDWQSKEEELARLEAEYQEGLHVCKPSHPRMVELSRRVERARRALQTSTDLARQRLESRQHALAIQASSLDTAAKQWKSEAGFTSTQRARYEELKTKVDHLRSRYEQVYALILDTKVAQGDSIFRNVVEAPAVHVNLRNAYRALGLSLAVALAVGVCLALLLDSLDVSLRDPETIEQRLGLTYLQAVPRWSHALRHRGNGRGVVVVSQSQPNAATEVYRNLRGAVEGALGEEGSRVLLVTSARPGDGKSLTAVNLAVTFAWTGKRVLLVDGDLRRGVLAQSLGQVVGKGFSDVLSGEVADWRTVVSATEHPDLWLLAAGRYRRDAPELMRPNRLREMLSGFRGLYDVVIVDSPPVGKVVETEVLGRVCDGVLLVTRFGRTRFAEVRHALRRLDPDRVLGFCINAVEISSRRYASTYAGEYYSAKEYRRNGPDEPATKAPGPAEPQAANP